MINQSSLKLQTYCIHFNILTLTIFFSLFVTPILLSEISTSELFASEKLINAGNELVKSSKIESIEWTPQEEWVWKYICEGKVADFNESKDYGGKLDPKKSEGWQNNRILRPIFLETILFHEPFRSALTHKGVNINGAWFTESLNLSNATLTQLLCLNNSRFEEDVDFSELRTSHTISLEGSKIIGKLEMSFLETNGNLLINEAEYSFVNIGKAKIDGILSLDNSRFTDMLIMSSIKVKGDLRMNNNTFEIQETIMKDFFKKNNIEPCAVLLTNAEVGNLFIYGCKFISPKSEFNKLNMKALKVYGYLQMEKDSEFGEVDLLRAKIEGQVIISNSKFKDTLSMQSLELNGDFIIRSKVRFSVVDLRGAEIGGLFEITDAEFNDKLDMSFIKVNINVIIRNTFKNKVLLPFANIGQNLDISNSKFSSLDLGSAQINGELQLFSENDQPTSTQWEKGAKLILQNTVVGVIKDSQNSWPDYLELDGFVYKYFGIFTENNEDEDRLAPRSRWFLIWLAKQNKYTSQPYEQLASILQKAGYKGKASDILYASKERERKKVAKGWYKVWLFLLNWSIGYGFGHRLLFHPLGVVLIFTLLGASIFYYFNKEWKEKRILSRHKHNFLWCILYSLDMLLPIIKLDERHYKINLEGVTKYYFYFHKIVGFALASFIVAGISGLTK